jgi:hypothetical protein
MITKKSLAAVCLVAMMSVGCGGVKIAVKNPTVGSETVLSSSKVSAIDVATSSALEGDKQALITKNDVPNKMKAALMDSLKRGGYADAGAGALKVKVDITDMRLPKNPGMGGPDHVAGTVTVTDAAGATVKSFEAQSTSTTGMFVGGSRASRFSKILSDFSQKIVNGL